LLNEAIPYYSYATFALPEFLPCHLRNINHLQTFSRKTQDLAQSDLDASGRHRAAYFSLDSIRTPGFPELACGVLSRARLSVAIEDGAYFTTGGAPAIDYKWLEPVVAEGCPDFVGAQDVRQR
jgi:hypothetical protein